MHLPSAAHAEGIRRIGILDAEGNVAQKFAVQPLSEVPRRDELPLFPREGRVVDGEDHLHRGIGDLDEGHGLHAGGSAQRIADVDLFKAGKTDDVARHGAFAGTRSSPSIS